jgi:protein arginine N-methyltransferase 5
MYSWFPLFFPLRAPLYLPSGSEVEVHVWRLSEGRGRRVWYEWAAEAYLPGAAGSVGMGGGSGVGPGGGLSPGLGLGGPLGTPTGSLNGRPPLSPMMDATFSPVRNTFLGAGGAGFGEQGSGQGRVKIGQTGLHNAAGVHSWVGL